MAKNRAVKSMQEAREQAAEYFGFSAGVTLQVGDEKFEIPNPGMLSDDQQERYNKLLHDMRTRYDRENSFNIPDQTLEDGTFVPGRVIPGELIEPHCIDGELLPPYWARIGVVLWGEEGYKKFRAAGGSSSQINLEWGRMNREFAERVESDPKSDGSAGSLESVPTGDSV